MDSDYNWVIRSSIILNGISSLAEGLTYAYFYVIMAT